MSDYDEIIESKSKPKENHFPKKDWKAEKNSLFETANNAAVDTVYSGKNLRKYLETQSRFDKYSATNVLLIMSQKPEATQIKDYNSWQKAGVTVKKFEKSFSILEPGKEYKTESGEIRQNFNIKKMFDISQTTAQPEEKPEVNFDEKLLLKALIHKSPVPIQMADHLDFNRGAFYDHEKETLFVLRGMSAPDIFRSVSKELAFAELAKTRSDYHRSECEFPAYCASFILCQKNGIDTKDYDFSRIPESIRSKESAQIRAQLGEIRETAVNIMERMNKVLVPEKVPKTKEQER